MDADKLTSRSVEVVNAANTLAVNEGNPQVDPVHLAVALLRQMDQLRDQAQRMIERGENPTPEMEQQLDDLLSKVQVNSNYQRAIAAQENFDKTMLQVNNWITEGIRKGATSSIITLG